MVAAAGGDAAPEDVKALAKAQAALASMRALLAEQRAALVGLGARRVPPREPVLKVLTAVWLLLGRKTEAFTDATAPDAAALAWPVARGLVDAAFADALQEGGFDATAPAVKALAYAREDALRALLEGVPAAEELAPKEGPVAGALAGWVRAALDVRAAAAAKRAREKEEAAAKEAADKEAAEAAAAAAAEAAAAAAEGGEAAAEEEAE